MRKWLFLAAGVVISLVFLYSGLRGLSLGDVAAHIGEANLLWLIPGVAIYFLAVWGRTWRWHYLLRPLKAVRLSALFPVVVIGYMGNNVYPFRAGEVIRAYVLKRNEGVSISASLATIVVERLLDGLVMLMFVFVALPFAPIEQEWLRTVVILFTIIFFGALAVFFALAAQPERARKLYRALYARFLPRFAQTPALELTDHFMTGLASLRSPRDLLMTFVTSTFIWLTETVKYWFVMHAFNFEVSFFVLMIMTAVVNLATTLPAAPGYVGTFDGPGIIVLEAFGVRHEIAASYTLVLHAALWLPITVLGFYYLVKQGLSWRSFGEAARAVEAERGKEAEAEGAVL
ncbi:MAG: flippase-like domain-containing protein [Anaerolineae bacterium]|nr:flippase-like domain-containing protein [Anaerolineae bacterium]